MEKRVFGMILTILGMLGLVVAGYQFMSNSSGTHSIKSIVLFLFLGLIFFSAGIGLLRNTKDRAT